MIIRRPVEDEQKAGCEARPVIVVAAIAPRNLYDSNKIRVIFGAWDCAPFFAPVNGKRISRDKNKRNQLRPGPPPEIIHLDR